MVEFKNNVNVNGEWDLNIDMDSTHICIKISESVNMITLCKSKKEKDEYNVNKEYLIIGFCWTGNLLPSE